MRAVVCSEPGGPEVLGIAELPEPEVGPGEVLLAVVAAGVNRADLLQRAGHYPPPPGASEILGLECVGRVVAVGDGVPPTLIGSERVALLAGGGYAERVAVPVGQTTTLPAGLDPIAAAGLIEVAATVVSNLDHAALRPGGSVLVHGGAGGVGSFAIQYAAAIGCTVLATAGTEEKRRRCLELGAVAAFDHHGDWPSEVRSATDGDGVDVVLDVVGGATLAPNVSVLAMDGTLLVIGFQGGRRGELDLGALLARRGTVAALALRSRPVEQKAAICRRLESVVWPLVAAGRIQVEPSATFDLAEAAQAHRLLESGKSHGKLVLTVATD